MNDNVLVLAGYNPKQNDRLFKNLADLNDYQDNSPTHNSLRIHEY